MMIASRSQLARQSLSLSIDPAPYSTMNLQPSPEESLNSPSSSRASIGTAGTTPTSGSSMSDMLVFSVLCMYDFQSDDAEHLPFSKNEILDIVKQEDTGWWAAMRRGGDVIGWVPKAFVTPLSEEMAERLLNVREELRIYEYEAEQLYAAPVTRTHWSEAEPEPSPSAVWRNGAVARDPRRNQSYNDSPQRVSRYPPPSPSTPMPQPPTMVGSINKPTPPTPRDSDFTGYPPRDRAHSSPSLNGRLDNASLPQIQTLPEHMMNGGGGGSPAKGSPSRPRPSKIARLTGSEDALVFHHAVQAQANTPWYLKPRHPLQVEPDGMIKSGTKLALVERLVSDTAAKDLFKVAQETQYRNVFLMTFRTFMTADELFDMLVDMYRMDIPNGLSDAEFEEWKERCRAPTQRLVLTVFTVWLQEHRLLEEEPHIAQRLTDFLSLICSPAPLASAAKLIVKLIESLTFANPSGASPTAPRRRRKSRAHKGDLLKLEPADIAEQLSLLEYKLYTKITPQECITYSKSQTGKTGKCVPGLTQFCATHDKVAEWVQGSILANDALGRRADTVDFWIKVAEKCRGLNNFASMSAVINALSSVNITRLHLTWAHVGRKSNLDALLKFNEPTGGFSGYRSLMVNADGPCVPFVMPYLTDIQHIKDQFDDGEQISFIQRQRWFDVVSFILKFQGKPYNIAESESTSNFISGHLNVMVGKDFWKRSVEVQQSELAHADIRRGLEAAGF